MTLDSCLFTLPSIPFLFYHSYEENALILLTNIHNCIVQENTRDKFKFCPSNY